MIWLVWTVLLLILIEIRTFQNVIEKVKSLCSRKHYILDIVCIYMSLYYVTQIIYY